MIHYTSLLYFWIEKLIKAQAKCNNMDCTISSTVQFDAEGSRSFIINLEGTPHMVSITPTKEEADKSIGLLEEEAEDMSDLTINKLLERGGM